MRIEVADCMLVESRASIAGSGFFGVHVNTHGVDAEHFHLHEVLRGLIASHTRVKITIDVEEPGRGPGKTLMEIFGEEEGPMEKDKVELFDDSGRDYRAWLESLSAREVYKAVTGVDFEDVYVMLSKRRFEVLKMTVRWLGALGVPLYQSKMCLRAALELLKEVGGIDA